MNALRPSEWLESAAEVVGRITNRWGAAGALAANAYRLLDRATGDADMVVAWHAELIDALEAAGYSLRVIAYPGDTPHLVIARRGDERVDLLFPTVEYQEVALDRATERHILTVEDVLIHKLVAWRPKDIDDIASILRADHPLDRAYIEQWAEVFDVLDRWREATGPR
jgi:hypothetical protein